MLHVGWRLVKCMSHKAILRALLHHCPVPTDLAWAVLEVTELRAADHLHQRKEKTIQAVKRTPYIN